MPTSSFFIQKDGHCNLPFFWTWFSGVAESMFVYLTEELRWEEISC